MEKIIWNDIEQVAKYDLRELIDRTESIFGSQIIDISNAIIQNQQVKIILLAGPSASGKTTTTKLLSLRLQSAGKIVHTISTDDFFRNRSELRVLPSGAMDFDSLDAMRVDALQDAINKLVQGKIVQLPRFNFIKGEWENGEILQINKDDILIIEGIHALNPIFIQDLSQAMLDSIVRIYIEPKRTFWINDNKALSPNKLRLLRRLSRDYYSRGHSFEGTLNQWQEVRSAEDKYIRPYEIFAQFNIDSTHDYELLLFRQYIYDQISSANLEQLKHLEEVLGEIELINIDYIPKNSLLHEFVDIKER